MDPELVALFEHGGLIGALCAACWFLSRRNDILVSKVESRYDAELSEVRRRLDTCEKDREKLHATITTILQENDERPSK